MAGSQVTIAAAQVDAQRLGYMAISLTEFDTTAEPAIHAGSKVEISGALYQFGADEAITGWAAIASSTDAYIKLVPAGAAVTAEFTDDAPTWSDSKQGWYKTVGMAVHRYVAKLYKDAGDLYTLKRLLTNVQQTPVDALVPKIVSDVDGVLLRCKVIEIGAWDMDTTETVTIDTGIDRRKWRIVNVLIQSNSATNQIAPIEAGGKWLGDSVVSDNYIVLTRTAAGYFDSGAYNSVAYTRGWITIWYEE